MGYKEISIAVPTSMHIKDVELKALKKCSIKNGRIRILKKSLDARRKGNIVFNYRLAVTSAELKSPEPIKKKNSLDEEIAELKKSPKKRRIVIVGTGPAGIFPAIYLQRRGENVIVIEQGSDVENRSVAIESFEHGGNFDKLNNYPFGEGGAGTFSDGKLTSRTKTIKEERDWIYRLFIEAGAPEEILWSTHPHLGSDKLIGITKNLRKLFVESGGIIHFNTKLIDLETSNGKVDLIVTNSGKIDLDELIIAPGHSSFDTYRMLLSHNIPFKTKNFAIGARMEHRRIDINKLQWGVEELPGVKAAEYRITSQAANKPVYSFCMCPGGRIVAATAEEDSNIVNGMSLYARNEEFSNAAIVAGINPDEYFNSTTPNKLLDWLENLERSVKTLTKDFRAPAESIESLINKKNNSFCSESSYSFGLLQNDIYSYLPMDIADSIKIGLTDICKRMPIFAKGNLIGLETKSSAPLQVIRDKNRKVEGFSNLTICGEGSGWAGGIISSAADGLKAVRT